MTKLPMTAAGHAALEDELTSASESSAHVRSANFRKRLPTIPTWLRILSTRLPRQTKRSMRPVLSNLRTNLHGLR